MGRTLVGTGFYPVGSKKQWEESRAGARSLRQVMLEVHCLGCMEKWLWEEVSEERIRNRK